MQQNKLAKAASPKQKDAIQQVKGILSPLNNPRWISFGVYGVLLTIGVIIGTLAWNWSDLQSNSSEQSKRRFDAALSVVSTGAAIAGGLVVFLNFRVAQRKLEQETQKAEADKKLAESRLTMERFNKAVEMLGKDDSIHLRLGGIYSLESIADDSDPDAPDEDYRQVLEVLTAFVKENSPWPPKEQGGELTEVDEVFLEEIPPLPTDIQAVLTVLNRRRHKKKDWEQYPLDLSKTDLRRASLRGVNLRKVYLTNANLQKVDLREAKLQQAQLQRVNLQEARLEEAILLRASFWNANLQSADLFRASLQGVCLTHAKLQNANLEKANLRGAGLVDANLQNTNLERANLQKADLEGANLQGAHLRRANLRGAKFWYIYLSDTELAEAKEKSLANLKSAQGWEEAYYDPEIREWLGLPPEPA